MPRLRTTLEKLLLPRRLDKPRRRSESAHENPALEAIWHAVSTIPRGRVSTYGAVARAAGLPGRARQAGFALRVAPQGLRLPWHRVLGAGGRIVFPLSSPQHREQARLLRSEGIVVKRGRVSQSFLMDC